MNETNLKELLKQLHQVLEKTDSVDPDTLKQVRELDDEVNRLLESGSSGEEFENVVDQAKAVETRFAVDHPVAERFLREIVDTLSKVGI
jgi:phosphate uptake regulator